MNDPTRRETTPPSEAAARRNLFAALKLLALGVLVCVLWIPLQLVHGLVTQREGRQVQVEQEIAASWGGPQSLRGPVLVLRYECVEEPLRRDRCDGVTSRQRFVHSQETRWQGTVSAQALSRSLFDAVVWQAQLEAGATFPAIAEELERDGRRWRLGGAGVAVSVSDEVGLMEGARLEALGVAAPESSADMKIVALPGFDSLALVGALPVESMADAEGKAELAWLLAGAEVRVALELQGTRRLAFRMAPGATEVALESSWPSPSFDGARLPAERQVDEDVFTAQWRVRGDGAQPTSWWSDDGHHLASADFGVSLVEPVDGYRLARRSTEYGVLFIVLTFATFLLLEILTRQRLHPAQYFLVGAALCVFYLLLLSFSEHVRFGVAYFVAGSATVLLISLYALGISGRSSWAAVLFFGLSGLYTYLYVLLQLENLALLMGSIGLFAVLSAVMWTTRRFDWYRFERIPAEGA